MIYDVIIAGLGPAGSIAARTLAARGMRVLAFDKQYMPRDKPCGGAVSTRVGQVLDDDLRAVCEATIQGATFTFRGAEQFAARFHKPVVYMVRRSQFDQHLSQSARDQGAHLHEGESIRAICIRKTSVEVTTSRQVYRAAWLIGADGANSLVRRQVTRDHHASPITGLEAEIAPEHRVMQQHADVVRLDFGAIPNGYSWLFPKRHHLSVGIAGAFRQAPHPRRLYEHFLTRQGLGHWTDAKVHGHMIPIYLGGQAQVQRQRALLIGDAARLVDPFLGEGIYYAIQSAHIASHAILDATQQGLSAGELYEQRLQDVLADLRTALKMARLLYCFPHYGYYLFKTRPKLVEMYFQVLCGDSSLTEFYRILRRTALSSVLRSARWLRGVQFRVPVMTGDNGSPAKFHRNHPTPAIRRDG